MSEFAVKVKAPQYGYGMFVTSRGALNRLRIHAARFTDEETAKRTVEINREKHPDWEWKVVPL